MTDPIISYLTDEGPPGSWCGDPTPRCPARSRHPRAIPSRQISYRTFTKNVDLKPHRRAKEYWTWHLPTDFMVAFWKGQLPSGKPVYFLQHSAIEHIFTPDGNIDVGKEDRLARECGC